MRAGRLDRSLTLQARALGSPNAYGEKVPTYSTLAEVPGELRPVSGREYVSSGQLHAEASVIFRIRYRAGLTTIHRVVCDGVSYDILHIAEIGRRAGLELVCKTVPT